MERGLTDAVLCPGSRNAPLSFALLADPRITLHTRIDERTAAFVALGLAKVTHRPTAIVTTSGTAAANLHPAVLEAAHAGVTLVAVTADRPARMRRTGANQTTDQVRLFGDAASFVDLTEPDDDALAAAWHPGGPIQLNIQLDDPLLPVPGSPHHSDPRHAGERVRTMGTIRGGAGGPTPRRSSSRPASARWWWRGTTPVHRRGSWRSARGGRCSPSRAAGPGRA